MKTDFQHFPAPHQHLLGFLKAITLQLSTACLLSLLLPSVAKPIFVGQSDFCPSKGRRETSHTQKYVPNSRILHRGCVAHEKV